MSSALTPQEARFLALSASGNNNHEKSEMMYISIREVDEISKRVKRKLNAKSLPQAVLLAHKLGYISLPDDAGQVTAQSPFSESALYVHYTNGGGQK